MSNKLYDALKWIAQILLPAVATLYFAMASIWGLPYAEQVVGSLTALDAFLGALLGISSANYNKEQSKPKPETVYYHYRSDNYEDNGRID